jgi:transaldolase
MSPLERLAELGQSVWLDFLDHELLVSGELEQRITRDGVSGMTSNPTIFQKAIAGSAAYDDLIRRSQSSEPVSSVLERIMVTDIRAACDRFRAVYESTEGGDGFVSIEVSPAAARNTQRSVEEARRLWNAVDRPNLMVKIPGTREGLPAIRRCLADGININITLLFSVRRYAEVAEAYLGALEARLAKGERIDRVASVASFFVSRVDSKVDRALDAIPNALAGAAEALRGQIAIANAKVAYDHYEGLVASDRFRALAARGARPQRLLWASTSPKDPAYSDVYYVEALIGGDTVDTMTPETLRAYLEHGHPEPRLTRARDLAHRQLAALAPLAIDFPAITEALEDEGVRAFADSFQKAIDVITEKRRRLSAA